MRLIDGDKLFDVIDGKVPAPYEDSREAKEECLREISEAPTIDAVPVVRCRECRHSYESVSGLCCTMGPCVDCIVPEGFFCSHGERKED